MSVRRVVTSRIANLTVRRAIRLLAMVHELHKAGYQRIRISPGMAPSGMHWRCPITVAANIDVDGYSISKWEDGLVAPYTTGQEDYFDWPGASKLTARRLAAQFVVSFPRIVEAGAGCDWPYAGWLTDVIGRAEQGGHDALPVFYADYPLDDDLVRLWQPPPPSR